MLTDKQVRILAFIRQAIDQHGYPPTRREIGKAVGVSSTSVVNYHLAKLVKAGEIERGAWGCTRALTLPGSFSARPGDRVVVELDGGDVVTATIVEPAAVAA